MANVVRGGTRRRAPAFAMLAVVIAGMVAGSRVPAAMAARVPTGFADSVLVGGLDYPTGMAFTPDGRLLLVEQKTARVRLVVRGALATPDPVLTVANVNTVGSERGLLGIVVDPGWPERPYVYIHCTDAALGKVRVTRYQAGGDVAFAGDGHLAIDPASRRDLLADIPDAAYNHNGGTLRFGPDGMLYVSLGEDAARCYAQDTVSLRGVILRLDVSRVPDGGGAPADKALLVAPGNPFASHPNPNARLVWAIGLRNPFRFHIDPADGALFIGDVGEARWEEIDRAAGGGRDFGWPAYEGTTPFESCLNSVRGDDPIYVLDRNAIGTAAIISAGVYRRGAGARTFPAPYEGDYFFGEYYTGILRRLEGSGASWHVAAPVPGQPSSANWGEGFAETSDWLQGPDGALWYCRQAVDFAAHTGFIGRIVAAVSDTNPPPPPPPPPPGDTLTFQFPPPRPTPAPGATTLSFTLEAPARVRLVVYDIGGRAVRTLLDGAALPARAHAVPWDGADEHGRAAPPGLYVVRLTVDGRTLAHRFPLLR